MPNTKVKPLDRLLLPRRWEHLLRQAENAHVDPLDLVERVESGERRVNELLARLHSGAGGVFEIFFGLSGSGKTTFVKSLPRFFQNVKVISFDSVNDLADLPNFVEDHLSGQSVRNVIVLIQDRDNPEDSDWKNPKRYLRKWLNFFRTTAGNVVIIWTITDEEAAKQIAAAAWQAGSDSVCSPDTRGLYSFDGLPKEKYYLVANHTAESLSGQGLESYGISKEVATEILPQSSTISAFYQKVIDYSNKNAERLESVLEERGRPRLWVLLHGDDRNAIGVTASALAFGSHGQIDLSRVIDSIDDEKNAATYAKEWRTRRKNIGRLLRTIDLRVFPIPPNVSVHAARCFGDSTVKEKLTNKLPSKTTDISALQSTLAYKELLVLLGNEALPAKSSGTLSDSTLDDYRSLQTLARNNDEKLNAALGRLFEAALREDGYSNEVIVEKPSAVIPGIQADIIIKVSDGDYVCLEPTWRAGSQIGEGGTRERQNTMSEGHIKPYVLEKASKYIAALDL